MNISYKTDISKIFLYKHAFKCYNDSKERLFDKGNRKITYRKDGPIMKTTNAKSVQSDFTYPAGDPPPVVAKTAKTRRSIERNVKIMRSLLKNPNLDNLMILNVVLQVLDEAEQ